MRKPVVDVNGRLRMGYWEHNDALKGKAVPIIGGSDRRDGLPGFNAGSVIELRRVGEGRYRWSVDGAEVIEHEAPPGDDLVWGVGGEGEAAWEAISETFA